MNPITFTLPWPPNTLSPNTRSHWSVLAKAKKRYRTTCCISVLEQRAPRPSWARIDVTLRLVPPDARRRDVDNCIAAAKSGLDGVAHAWGIDDSAFIRVTGEMGDPDAAHSGVVVTLREHVAAGVGS